MEQVLYLGIVIASGGTNFNIWLLFSWVVSFEPLEHVVQICFLCSIFVPKLTLPKIWMAAGCQPIPSCARNTSMVLTEIWGLSSKSKGYNPFHILIKRQLRHLTLMAPIPKDELEDHCIFYRCIVMWLSFCVMSQCRFWKFMLLVVNLDIHVHTDLISVSFSRNNEQLAQLSSFSSFRGQYEPKAHQ